MHESKLNELLASAFAATALEYFSCSCNLKASPTRTIHTKRATTVFVQLNNQYYVLAYGYILVIAAFKDNKVECKFSTPDKMYVKEILTTPTHPNTFVFHEGKRIYACNWQRKQLIHLKTLPIVHKVVLLGSYIIYTSGAPTTRISIGTLPKLREPFTEFDNIIGTNFLVLPSGNLIVASEKNLYLYDFVEYIDIYAHTERITDIALFDSSHIVIFSANKFFGINRVFNYETKSVVRAILEPKQVLTVLPKQGILRMESTNNIKWEIGTITGISYWKENTVAVSADRNKRTVQIYYNDRIEIYSMDSIDEFQRNLLQRAYNNQVIDVQIIHS